MRAGATVRFESVRPGLSYGARIATARYSSRGRPKPKSVRATKPTRVHKTSIPNWSAIPAHTPKTIPLRRFLRKPWFISFLSIPAFGPAFFGGGGWSGDQPTAMRSVRADSGEERAEESSVGKECVRTGRSRGGQG